MSTKSRGVKTSGRIGITIKGSSPSKMGKISVNKTGNTKPEGKVVGTSSKTGNSSGRNYFVKGDKPVAKTAFPSKGTRNSLRNTYPADEGRGFTGTPKPDGNENLRTKSDVVKVILWEPTKSAKKVSGGLKSIKSSK